MITLSKTDISNLLSALELKPEYVQALSSSFELDDDFADELRDLCSDRLDICGYDENYKLNKDGRVLQDLVDKLFTGI